ncbi:Inosine-5'-monophosphate dehydrogenase (plasmid) [Sulfitobacter sp. DSM 110093]|nr:Inosine-5'-monophosphate dehydrogenase [Sulfitobacter sp. DSM 110093]
MIRDPMTVTPELSLAELADAVFLKHGISFVPVIENEVLLGYVDARIVQKIDLENRTTTIVDDVVESTNKDNTVCYGSTAVELMDTVKRTGRRKFLVADRQKLVGVITLSDLTSVLTISDGIE